MTLSENKEEFRTLFARVHIKSIKAPTLQKVVIEVQEPDDQPGLFPVLEQHLIQPETIVDLKKNEFSYQRAGRKQLQGIKK
jgi:hypothetical protein